MNRVLLVGVLVLLWAGPACLSADLGGIMMPIEETGETEDDAEAAVETEQPADEDASEGLEAGPDPSTGTDSSVDVPDQDISGSGPAPDGLGTP